VSIEERVMKATGTNVWGDGQAMPPEPKPLRYRFEGRDMVPAEAGDREYQIIASNNDGFELWFGWNDHWEHHMGSSEVRALFWWLLWEWYAKARWFGLRRPIYYWALRRHVNRFRSPVPADTTGGAN
jgi:hypothetical protein